MSADDGEMGLLEATSIGVGGMVGGGIFAVLGVAVHLGGRLAWVSFGLGGLVAVLTAYSFWKLGLEYPSRGGAVEYLNQVFGVNAATGGVNWLLWMGYVLMISIYAAAFGAYGAHLAGSHIVLLEHVLATAVILGLVAVNAVGTGQVGTTEDVLVVLKLLILGLFVGAGLTAAHPSRALASPGTGVGGIVAAGAIIFLADEGFELVANATGDMADPEATLPRALFVSTGFVAVLYVAITFVSLATLSPAEIAAAKEYALARAAEPTLGSAGFALVSVAALLSTAGAINSSLYGTMRLTFVMACDRELPSAFEASFHGRHLVGLLLTAALSLLAANLLPIEDIALLGSSVFLVVFALVNLAAARDRGNLGIRPWIPLVAALACGGSLVAVLAYGLRRNPTGLAFLAGIVVASFGMEAVYRRWWDEHDHPAEAHDV